MAKLIVRNSAVQNSFNIIKSASSNLSSASSTLNSITIPAGFNKGNDIKSIAYAIDSNIMLANNTATQIDTFLNKIITAEKLNQSLTASIISKVGKTIKVATKKATGGARILDPTKTPNYCQWKGAWANIVYGNGSVAHTGCGPTVAAIAITALTGKEVTPDQTCEYLYKNELYNSSVWQSTGDAGIEACAKNWGLNAKNTTSQNEVKEALKDGKVVAVIVNHSAFYDKGPHYICLVGYKEDNTTFVRDPNNEENPGSTWHNIDDIFAKTDPTAPGQKYTIMWGK